MTLRSTSTASWQCHASATLCSVWAQIRWFAVVNVDTLDMVTILDAQGELIYELSENCSVRYAVSLNQMPMLIQVSKMRVCMVIILYDNLSV